VEVPKKDDEGNAIRDEASEEVREVLLEVEDIHKAILERNKKHFHQADETPFAKGAENTVLYDLIGYTGMSQAAKKVVDGTFLEKYGDELGVGKEMPISRIVVAVPNATVVLLD
jgi:hypothetical protein